MSDSHPDLTAVHSPVPADRDTTADGHAGPPPTELPATRVGRFEILGEIARGGMGVVYRARDPEFDRDVAVKMLHHPAAEAPAVRRFVQEARITGQLQHPGIPVAFDLGVREDGRPYLAMELIQGRTLSDLLAGRATPADDLPRWVAVFEDVCQAVAYAHSRGVMHRDLKPGNVMVGAFGEVQVMDWGLAKVLAGGGHEHPDRVPGGDGRDLDREADLPRPPDGTQAGSVLGTPAYMPPEQARGEVDRVDERADVFALGAILCVILTGRPPYVGATSEAVRLMAIRGQLGDALARLDGCGAEPELVALAKRCLAPDPADRPASADGVAKAVAGLRAAAEERARRAELDRAAAEVKAAEQRKRRRVQLVLAAAVLVLVAGGAGWWWWADRQAAEQWLAAEVALDQTETALRQDNPVYGEIDAALAQAEKRLADGGREDLRARLAELTKARRVLDRLDAIDVQRWSYSTRFSLDFESARAAYQAVFAEYGLDPSAEPPGVLADKTRRSLIATQLTAALYDWLSIGGPPTLLDLLDALDPDPDRAALRRNLVANDRKAIAEQIARLDGRTLPPAFAAFVGRHGRVPQDHALRVLRAAQDAHPNHFGLAFRTAYRSTATHPEEAITYYRIAIAIRPANAVARQNLGLVLSDQDDLAGAEAAFREAVRLAPTVPAGHINLGNILLENGNLAGAEAAYREAIRVGPTIAAGHSNLGNVLAKKGNLAGAEAAYREAVRSNPGFQDAYGRLVGVLTTTGRPLAALGVLQQGGRHDPTWLADPTTGFRYGLAFCACLAAAGSGNDDPPPGERPALRKQAFDWLAADLAAWRKLLAADPAKNRPVIHARMELWLDNAYFASVRHPIAVGLLPADEREAWRKLWADVRRLRDQTAPEPAPPRPARP